MTIDNRPTVSQPDDDPYLWLEEIDGARATAWADAETQRTRKAVLTPAALRDRDVLAALLDRPDKIPLISRRGRFVYNFWQDKENPRGLWRRTTLDAFRGSSPPWDVLLDVDALARSDGEDWVWHGASVLPVTHERAILSLSRGGSDASVHREFDMTARTFVPDGFHLAEAKGGVDWWDGDTLIVSSAIGGDAFVTTSGYARTVRLWRRGQAIDAASVIFEVDAGTMAAAGQVDRSTTPQRLWLIERTAFFDGWIYRSDLAGNRSKLDLPSDVQADIEGDWLFVKPRTPWAVDGKIIVADQLVAFALEAFECGERRFATLFTPGERCILDGWTATGGKITLSILDNLQPRFEEHAATAAGWSKRDLEGLPSNGVVNIWRLDADDASANGDLLAMSQDPVTPPTLSVLEVEKAPTILKQAPTNFDARGCIVRQFEAVASDGERIPYTVTGPASAPDGNAPVHMSGYGGFQVSTRPAYVTSIGKLWLERGGTDVTTNIRGGGEFGTRWHEAGRGANKITSHDDFAAIASDLVKRGITQPKRIAAQGGSNGGILISNMLTRYPERFGGLFCTIPLIDMRRYTKLLAGASWIAEYGDPEKLEDWTHLQRYSAYHNAIAGQGYPPILIATTRKDDRVHPGHARKFAAKLQALGYDNVRYFESATGGHGYGKDTLERATFTTIGLTFLAHAIGWEWDAPAA